MRQARDYTLEKEAKAAFGELCKEGGDAQKDFRRWHASYPDVTPDSFESTARKDKDSRRRDRRAEALDLVYGKERQGERKGGFVGRGRVLNGKPYRRLCVGFDKVPGLRDLTFDASVQFDAEKMALVAAEMENQFDAGTCCFVEFGPKGKGNHINVLTPKGRGLVVPDDELPGWVAYISKLPPLVESLAVAYIDARRASNARALPSRRFGIGCSPRTHPVPLAAIEGILGAIPAKRKRTVKQKAPGQEETVIAAEPALIAAARLPLLQGATPETLVIIKQLQAAWAAGAYNGMAFAHGPAKMADLGRTFSYYFTVRTKLFDGETYHLEQYARALGFDAVTVPTKTEKSETFVTRKHISHVIAAPENASVRRLS